MKNCNKHFLHFILELRKKDCGEVYPLYFSLSLLDLFFLVSLSSSMVFLFPCEY